MKEAPLDGDVRVKVGEPFGVRLRAEGTTGRHWDLIAPAAITIVDTFTEKALGFGARPIRWHVFKCKVAGEYDIDLRLHRPWESTTGERHTVHVVCVGERT